MLRRSFLVGSAIALAVPAPALAWQDDIWSKLVNTPSTAWNHWGVRQLSEERVDEALVPGGRARRIRVRSANENPWDVGVNQAIDPGFKKGDVVLLMIHAMANDLAEGETTGRMRVMLQEKAAPNDKIADLPLRIGGEWKSYYVSGVTPKDIPAGAAEIAMFFGDAKQSVSFGPAMVLNFGPDFDLGKLPTND